MRLTPPIPIHSSTDALWPGHGPDRGHPGRSGLDQPQRQGFIPQPSRLRHPDPGGKLATRSDGVMECWTGQALLISCFQEPMLPHRLHEFMSDCSGDPGLILRARRALVAAFGLAVTLAGAVHASERLPSPDEEINWAKEREFWSFQTPVSGALPAVRNRRWPQQRLDYFILARLEKHQISPAAEAGKRTLIRRVTYDLSGLPPTPEEVDAFLADSSAQAYER